MEWTKNEEHLPTIELHLDTLFKLLAYTQYPCNVLVWVRSQAQEAESSVCFGDDQ
jgi:hypothetical protein